MVLINKNTSVHPSINSYHPSSQVKTYLVDTYIFPILGRIGLHSRSMTSAGRNDVAVGSPMQENIVWTVKLLCCNVGVVFGAVSLSVSVQKLYFAQMVDDEGKHISIQWNHSKAQERQIVQVGLFSDQNVSR